MFTKTALAIALSVCAFNAQAADYSLVLHGLSKHSTTHSNRTGREWNERNIGLGLRITQSPEVSYQSGFYKNSEHSWSIYGGIDWTPLHLGPFSAGVAAGIVTGYDTYPVVPVGTLIVRSTLSSRIDVMVRYLPPIIPKMTSVAAIEVAFKF